MRKDQDRLDKLAAIPRTWAPGEEPTPGEWAKWFLGMRSEDQELVAWWVITRAEYDTQCYLSDHEGQIRDLTHALEKLGRRDGIRDSVTGRLNETDH